MAARFPQIVLVGSFAAFYALVEKLFLQPTLPTDPFDLGMVLIISFLNLIPAGIFAFTVTSFVPRGWGSTFNEDELLRVGSSPGGARPRIAVLYATYNDFMPDHAEYDVKQAQLGGLPFFILDDSSEKFERYRVDAFSRQHRCQVVRRKTRHGYKAGAINEWTARFGEDYDYIFVLDSDSEASCGSILYCAELARRNQGIAVVQSKTLTMTSTPSRFTSSAVTIQHAYMEVVQRAMKILGTSPYYGHNALINIGALRLVGGFVEETNEDYKTLARLHDRGFKSIYAERAVSWEEVPPDYLSARKRALRWARDAVMQPSLLRYSVPVAIAFFLFYGWVTHMSNVALVGFLSILSGTTFPRLFNNAFVELAGGITIALMTLWPLVALRTKDPELRSHRLASALFWGSVYNIPMVAPVAFQIIKTVASKIKARCVSLSSSERRFIEEFVVTPKTSEREVKVQSVVRKLRAEISLGVLLTIIGAGSGHAWAVVFATPQILSALSLPLLVYADLRGTKRRREIQVVLESAQPTVKPRT